MFNLKFIKGMKNFGLFFIGYTVIFVLFASTISYTFPFIAAFLIALLIQPITRFLKDKLKLRKNIPSLIASILVYIVFFALISLLFYKIVKEAKLLMTNLYAADLDAFISPIKDIIEQVGERLKDIDPEFIEKYSSQITRIVTNSTGILRKGLNTFLVLAVSIPVWITVLFVVILSTYFFSRDMGTIKEKTLSIFSESGREKFSNVWYQGIRMLVQYIKAYSIVYFLTFIQTLIGFSALRVRYAVILSIICALADVLPVLGIGLIYLPLAAIYLITGNYFVALGLIVLYILISVVRQIVEPRIVSTSLGIHPVLVLAILFIGFKAYGFVGMIYLTFMVVFYKVLKAAKVF